MFAVIFSMTTNDRATIGPFTDYEVARSFAIAHNLPHWLVVRQFTTQQYNVQQGVMKF